MANIKQININDTLYDIEALKAIQDGDGNVITSTYATKGDVTKVEQKAAITTAGEYPVILGATTDTSTIVNTVNKTSTLKYNPSTKVLTAPTFKGGLTTDGKNIILSSTNNYNTTTPSTGSVGQLFFAEEDYLELPTGGSVNQVLVKNSAGNGDAKWSTDIAGNAGTATKLAAAQTITLTGDVTGSASFTGNTACSITTTVANASHTHTWSNISDRASCTIKTSGTITGSKVYGAVWNDYAEFRICNDNFIPGQVVCENGDDTLSISTRRMQPGANIVSDTFGFAIGKTENAKCPIAVSGRVLAYTYEPREDFKPGEAVCAGPNGTISRMTREEIREYPECIIGTVSAIPEYDSWGENNTLVNNRIWIKI